MRGPKAHLAQNVREDLIPAQYKRCDNPFRRPGKHKRKPKPKECLQHRDDAALGALVLGERNKGEKAVQGDNCGRNRQKVKKREYRTGRNGPKDKAA